MTRQRIFNIRILAACALSIAALTLLTAFAAAATASNPVPLTNQPLVPDATAPGGPGVHTDGEWHWIRRNVSSQLERQAAIHDLCQ